jgi:hypothetical protein
VFAFIIITAFPWLLLNYAKGFFVFVFVSVPNGGAYWHQQAALCGANCTILYAHPLL